MANRATTAAGRTRRSWLVTASPKRRTGPCLRWMAARPSTNEGNLEEVARPTLPQPQAAPQRPSSRRSHRRSRKRLANAKMATGDIFVHDTSPGSGLALPNPLTAKKAPADTSAPTRGQEKKIMMLSWADHMDSLTAEGVGAATDFLTVARRVGQIAEKAVRVLVRRVMKPVAVRSSRLWMFLSQLGKLLRKFCSMHVQRKRRRRKQCCGTRLQQRPRWRTQCCGRWQP